MHHYYQVQSEKAEAQSSKKTKLIVQSHTAKKRLVCLKVILHKESPGLQFHWLKSSNNSLVNV